MPAICQKALRKGCSALCGRESCCWWPHVPPELNLIGFDMYGNGTTEVDLVRQYANACVFPSMATKQRFVAVPGCFAMKNSATTRRVVDQEDDMIAAKVDTYAAWAAADARVGGIKPWVSVCLCNQVHIYVRWRILVIL